MVVVLASRRSISIYTNTNNQHQHQRAETAPGEVER